MTPIVCAPPARAARATPAHHRHPAAAGDQRVPACREFGADGLGEVQIGRVDLLGRGTVDADRRHQRARSAAAAVAAASLRLLRGSLAVGRDDVLDDLGDVVGEAEQVEIGLGDLAAGEHRAAQPVDQALPVRHAVQHDREPRHLRGLHERERLERLVQRAEAAGHDHERLRVLHEHRLAGEEVAEVHAEIDPVVELLLERQLDAEPDRHAARLGRAAVDRLHRPRTAAGDDGEAGLGERARRSRGRRRTRDARAASAPSRTPRPRTAVRRAARSPRRTRSGCAAPATGRCAPSPTARASRAAADRSCPPAPARAAARPARAGAHSVPPCSGR